MYSCFTLMWYYHWDVVELNSVDWHDDILLHCLDVHWCYWLSSPWYMYIRYSLMWRLFNFSSIFYFLNVIFKILYENSFLRSTGASSHTRRHTLVQGGIILYDSSTNPYGSIESSYYTWFWLVQGLILNYLTTNSEYFALVLWVQIRQLVALLGSTISQVRINLILITCGCS